MNSDPRYVPVDAALPTTLPPLTMKEALSYYKKLVRHFGAKRFIPVGVLEQRYARQIFTPIVSRRNKARRCWASTKPTTGHFKGWGRLIHDASHYVFRQRHPSFKPHDGGHATLEREMAAYASRHFLNDLVKEAP